MNNKEGTPRNVHNGRITADCRGTAVSVGCVGCVRSARWPNICLCSVGENVDSLGVERFGVVVGMAGFVLGVLLDLTKKLWASAVGLMM